MSGPVNADALTRAAVLVADGADGVAVLLGLLAAARGVPGVPLLDARLRDYVDGLDADEATPLLAAWLAAHALSR